MAPSRVGVDPGWAEMLDQLDELLLERWTPAPERPAPDSGWRPARATSVVAHALPVIRRRPVLRSSGGPQRLVQRRRVVDEGQRPVGHRRDLLTGLGVGGRVEGPTGPVNGPCDRTRTARHRQRLESQTLQRPGDRVARRKLVVAGDLGCAVSARLTGTGPAKWSAWVVPRHGMSRPAWANAAA